MEALLRLDSKCVEEILIEPHTHTGKGERKGLQKKHTKRSSTTNCQSGEMRTLERCAPSVEWSANRATTNEPTNTVAVGN